MMPSKDPRRELRGMHLPRTRVNKECQLTGADLGPRLPRALLDRTLEGFARLERRNLHLLPALRIPAFPGLLIADVELPKARNLDLLARLERLPIASQGERIAGNPSSAQFPARRRHKALRR